MRLPPRSVIGRFNALVVGAGALSSLLAVAAIQQPKNTGLTHTLCRRLTPASVRRVAGNAAQPVLATGLPDVGAELLAAAVVFTLTVAGRNNEF